MQSAAGRRAIATLASKLHPPTPLSAQESKQLLNLLTTSFRDRLDQQHPDDPPNPARATSKTRAPRPASSHTSAQDHIDSILSNPLLSRKPALNCSPNDAIRMLETPVESLLDQIAVGTANISKALVCLKAAERIRKAARSKDNATLAPVIADWLQSSGVENSSQFINPLNTHSVQLQRLMVQVLMRVEKNSTPLWRWLKRSPEQRIKETRLSADRIEVFRSTLLREIGLCAYTSSRDEGLTIFLRALELYKSKHENTTLRMVGALGSALVARMEQEPFTNGSTQLYESFLNSVPVWVKDCWGSVVEAMLCLHHPTNPTPYPGLSLITTLEKEGSLMQKMRLSEHPARRKFMVRLSLGTAQQLVDQDKLAEAQMVMQFIQKHFPDLVPSNTTAQAERVADELTKEKEDQAWSLDIVNRLLPT